MKANAIAQSDPLAPGLRIGRYELIRRLAVGGMAEIYLARAIGIEGFQKLVVLKRILPQFAGNNGFISMFLDEARLTATLQHPNIAQVYDIGEFQGSYFFTMEFVRGADVRSMLKTALLRDQPIPIEHVVTIILGVAAGLHAAHEKRGLDGTPLDVVHRDVSPSNVLVSYDGAVKLVDFGIAKASQHRNRTQAGTLKGKAAYMSPEQCTGRPLDRRSDIFAMGILLYELACCRRLFVGESEFEIMSKIVHEDVTPPSAEDPTFPAELERILLRALRRDPDERYETAQEMQLDLEEFVRHEKLAVSTVKLGAFMRRMFRERMRSQEESIAEQLRTGELALHEDSSLDHTPHSELVVDDPEVEIEVEAASAISGRPLAAVHTAMFAAEGSAPIPLEEARPSARRHRRWPRVIVGVAAAVSALYVLNAREDFGVERRQVRATSESSEERPAPRSAVEAGRGSVDTSGAVKRVVAEEEPVAGPEDAVRADAEEEPVAGPDEAVRADAEEEPVAGPEEAVRADAEEKPVAPSRARARTKRRRSHALRPRNARKPVAREQLAPPPAEKEWSLDSPLPPPRRK